MVPTSQDGSVIADSLVAPELFAQIFDRHFATVFRFAERGGSVVDQASEVACETFTRAVVPIPVHRIVPRRGPLFLPCTRLLGIASKLILHERRRFARYPAAVDTCASAETRTDDLF